MYISLGDLLFHLLQSYLDPRLSRDLVKSGDLHLMKCFSLGYCGCEICIQINLTEQGTLLVVRLFSKARHNSR